MTLVPSGKTRVMVAQNIGRAEPLSGVGGMSESIDNEGAGPLKPAEDPMGAPFAPAPEPGPSLDTEGAMDDDLGTESVNDDVSIGADEEAQMAPKENKKTLTSYIFEKMQSYGYPGRRLQEFKSEFVKETVSPEGQKDIEVVIPDKKYPDEKGFTDTIEGDELKSIAHEVNQAFGLNFNGADRAGGKWTIKFTSADITDPEEGISHDTLDQVYGKPDKGSQPGKPGQSGQIGQKPAVESKPPVRASMMEMIKEGKDGVVKQLQKMIGE